MEQTRNEIAPTTNPSRKASPVDTVPEIEDTIFVTMVEVRELQLPSSYHPVVTDHDPSHWAEEDTISRENTDKSRG